MTKNNFNIIEEARKLEKYYINLNNRQKGVQFEKNIAFNKS